MQRALRRTLVLILLSLATLAGGALFEVWTEEQAGIEAFAEEQAIVARSLAVILEERLADVRKDAHLVVEAVDAGRRPTMTVLAPYTDLRVRTEGEARLLLPPPSTAFVLSVSVPGQGGASGRVVDLALPQSAITGMFSSFERPRNQVLLLLPPNDDTFRAGDGRVVAFPALAQALRSGATSMVLTREQSAHLGLVRRIAVAGLAGVDGGDVGRWGIATAVSMERLRDRERRARTRLVLLVLLSGGLVTSFGALALRRQRRELELSRELAVAAIERDHEARLDQAARAATLGTLAMGIAHEISTPASVIHGRAEQLAARVKSALPDDDRARTAVQAIADQALRISQVVRGFLSLARGDASAGAESVDVARLVEGAMELVEHRFHKARVNLITDVPHDLPALRGDRRLLEHALTNLLLNACDACSAGGTVEISAAVVGAGQSLTIEVLDDGAGISPENAAHVTEPFFTTKEAGQGTGLGLAITSEIVRAHRGQLTLAARTPRGTRAAITLPIQAQAQAHAPAPADVHVDKSRGQS